MGITKNCQGCGNPLPASALLFYCERCESRRDRERKVREKQSEERNEKLVEGLLSKGVEDPEGWILMNNIDFAVLTLSPIFFVFTWPFGRVEWLFWCWNQFFPDLDFYWYVIFVLALLYGVWFLLVVASDKGLFGDANPNTSIGFSKSHIIGLLIRWAILAIYSIIIVFHYFIVPLNEDFSSYLISKNRTDISENIPTLKENNNSEKNSEDPVINETNQNDAKPSNDNLNEDVDFEQSFLYSINDPDGYSNLRSSPFGDIIKKVYETETFNVIDTVDKHCKVIFPDGTVGFIHVSRVIQRTNPT